jgi:hypothetical protein
MELVKERKMFYEKPNNIDVFLTYFSLNSEPVYRKIYSNELETRVILRNNNSFHGEDPRPFVLNGKQYVITQRFNGSFETVQNFIVDVNTGEDSLYKVDRPHFFYGKNWTPFVHYNELYILHRFDPFTILKNGQVIIEFNTNLPKDGTNFCQYRGGSNGISIYDKIYGIGHRTLSQYDHIPFIWILDLTNRTVEIMNLKNFKKIETINDPTSLWIENDNFYLSIFESSKRWHDDNLNCRSLIYKINLQECILNSKDCDYYKFNY